MSKRRERTFPDICDDTPRHRLPQTQIKPVLTGNIRMQGSNDESKCDYIKTVKSENNDVTRYCDRSPIFDHRVKSGKCNVCSAPCSSCFHVDKVLMKSNDESAVETCTENTETGILSELSSVVGMNSTSDSFYGRSLGKVLKTSNTSALDYGIVHSKFDDQRVQEGNDDCLSGVSGTDENAFGRCDPDDGMIKHDQSTCGESSDKAPSSSSLIGLHSNSGLVEIPTPRRANDTTEQNMSNTLSKTSNWHDQNERDVGDDKPCGVRDELLQKSDDHVYLLPPRAVAKAPIDADRDDPKGMTLNSDVKNEVIDLDIHSVDETEDSEMVEQDVKVCDICGDAGREDLLATCSRCSDGAEHTYCMGEMLDKVPEGEWLCEECKNLEHMEIERRHKIARVHQNERNNSSCHASSEHVNSSDVEGQRTNVKSRISSKRLRDEADMEVSSRMKKSAIELFVESPEIANSGKVVHALSPESSSKSFDKGRDPYSLEYVSVNEATESASSASETRLHKFRGNFSKSNSFNSVSSNPRVKLVDHVDIQRLKSLKGHGSGHVVDRVIRSLGKSKSFKMTNSTHPEVKVRMSSPRESEIQDIKTTMQRTPYERQLLSKAELASISSSGCGPKIEKKAASVGESSSWTAANKQAIEPVVTIGKKAAPARSSSLAARRTTGLSTPLGEFRKPPALVNNTLVASSGDETNTIKQKSHQARLKDDSSASVATEEPPLNTNGGLSDGMSRHYDLANSGERTKEPSGSCFARLPAKLTKDEGPNIRAAIEAAVLRKPVPLLRNRILGQSDESTISNTSCEVASHHDRRSDSAGRKKISFYSEQADRSKASRGSTFNNMQQPSLVSTEGFSFAGRNGSRISNSPRGHFHNFPTAMPFRNLMAIPEHEHIWQGCFEICRSGKTVGSCDGIQAHLSTSTSPKVIEAVNKFKSKIVLNEVPRLSTWPLQFQEHGVREDNIALFLFAKDIDSYNKIYKVLVDNMMKKDLALKGVTNGIEFLIFSSNHLPENSRKWNMLFYLWGVFRAKKESCEQRIPESSIQCSTSQDNSQPRLSVAENRCSFRPMLPESQDSPAKNGQPLMPESSIQFSQSQDSTQHILSVLEDKCLIRPLMTETQDSPMIRPMIPESQNSPVKKENCPQQMLESSIQFSTSQDNTQPILSVPENRCAIRAMMPEGQESPACQQRMLEPSNQFSTSQENPKPISSVTGNRCSIKPMAEDLTRSQDSPPVLNMPSSLEQSPSFTVLRAADGYRGVKVSSFDQLDHKMNSVCGAAVQIDNAIQSRESAAAQEGGISSHRSPILTLKKSLSGMEQIKVQLDASPETRQLPHFLSKSVGGTPSADLGVRNILDNNQNLVKFGMDAGEPFMNRSTPKEEEEGRFARDLNVEPDKWISDNNESKPSGSEQVPCYSTCEAFEGNQLLDDRVQSPVPKSNNTPERYFFPIGSQQVTGVTLADGSSSWKMHLLEQNRAIERTPSLELALGAETKPSMQGIWPSFASDAKVNAEHNLDERGIRQEKDGSASLSLSLAFPFSQNEHSRKNSL